MILLENCATFLFSPLLNPRIHQRLINLFMQKAITEKTAQPIVRSGYNN